MRLARMPLLLLAAIGLCLVGIWAAGPAHACSCEGGPLSEYSDEVTLAFTGRQIDRTVYSQTADNGVALRFEVDEVFKGEAGENVEVRTPADSAACGADAAQRGTTGVAVFRSEGELTVFSCGSLTPPQEMIDVFGAGYPPLSTNVDTEYPIGVAAVAIGALIASVAAFAVLRHRSSTGSTQP